MIVTMMMMMPREKGHLAAVILPRLRTLQVLGAMLILGVLTFALLAMAIHSGQMTIPPPASPDQPVDMTMLRLVAAALGCTNLIGAVLLSIFSTNRMAQLIRSGDQESDPEHLFRSFTVRTLLTLALLEGAALFAVLVYFLGGQPIDLAIAAVPVFFMLIFFFPTEGRFRRFIESISSRAAAMA